MVLRLKNVSFIFLFHLHTTYKVDKSVRFFYNVSLTNIHAHIQVCGSLNDASDTFMFTISYTTPSKLRSHTQPWSYFLVSHNFINLFAFNRKFY